MTGEIRIFPQEIETNYVEVKPELKSSRRPAMNDGKLRAFGTSDLQGEQLGDPLFQLVIQHLHRLSAVTDLR